MSITLRTQTAAGATTKSDTLTQAELDNNFIDLLQNKLTDIVDDITPTLGGALDANSNNFTNVGTINSHTIPGGSGTFALTSDISASSGITTVTAGTGITVQQDDSAGEVTISATSSFAPASPGELGASTPDVGNFTDLKVKSASSTVKELQLHDQDNSNYVGFKAPTSVSTNKVYVLPSTDGTNGQVLQTDGGANLSWATAGGGGITDINGGSNITVTQDSAGGVTLSQETLSNPLNMNDQQLSNLSIKNYGEIVYTGGSDTGTITPNPNEGSVQKITLSGSITLNEFNSPASGDSMTLIVKQPASGGPYTLSSTMKFAGGTKTLSTTANAIDIITIFYDGTDYLASLSTNFS